MDLDGDVDGDGDGDVLGKQLLARAVDISVTMLAARTYAIASGSAVECAANLDALRTLAIMDANRHSRGIELLERIVAMLTKLCR